MKDVLTVGVLANDNPQGLILACRLLGHARVRVSVGGRLSRLLEDGWSLRAEDHRGNLRTVKTRILRRGSGEDAATTKSEEEASSLDTLWLCDWKDPASGWYSLSDCHLLLQTSKATDSKTVAMWLVEVCREDAVIISLQAGLHNARELRSVFGHEGGVGTVTEQDMPLVASHGGRKATGSVDTNDGVLSRRESASSIYSEFSGMEDDLDSCDRSASPIPPGLGGGMSSPSSLDPHDSPSAKERRKSTANGKSEEDGINGVGDGQSTGGAGNSNARQQQQHQERSKLRTTTPTKEVEEEEKMDGKTDDSISSNAHAQTASNMKKPQAVLLAGVLGYGACCLLDEHTKTMVCSLTHYGAIVVERLTRQNALQALGRVILLERAGFKVRYRAHEETNNWLWGDVVWRTFEAYGAALRMDRPNETRSLYALLCDKNPVHRRVYAGLLDEALSALRWQKVELMDPASSPFGLSFRASRSLLLLPQPVFELALWIVLYLRFPWESKLRASSPYCDSTMVHRYMAPFLNGEVVRIGFEGEVQTPLNQEILESLSLAARQQPNASSSVSSATKSSSASTSTDGSPSMASATSSGSLMVKTTPLPELYPMTSFLAVISCILLLFLIFLRFIWFVIEVTFFW